MLQVMLFTACNDLWRHRICSLQTAWLPAFPACCTMPAFSQPASRRCCQCLWPLRTCSCC